MNHTPDQPNRRILIIDDNRAIHEDFRKILCDQGSQAMDAAEAAMFGKSASNTPRTTFELDSAFQGQEGLELVKRAAESGRPYAMAFVDVRMPPGWDGILTTEKIWEQYPDLQVVICTAYADYSSGEMLRRIGQSDRMILLKKPFDIAEVSQLAHTLTEKWRFQQQTNSIMGQLNQRVAERTRELELANFQLQKEMTERARVEEYLRHAQKMEAVGRLAGGIAHDFNNILTVVRGHAGLLLATPELDPAIREPLTRIDDAAQRAAGLTRQLLTFSRKQVMQPETLDLNASINRQQDMLQRLLGEDIAVEIQMEEGATIHADAAMIEQAILNLAINARDAMPKGGRLLIRTRTIDISEEAAARNPKTRAGRFVCVSVADSGCGIAPEVMPRLFEPFFTTKEVGKGTGLGLATVYGIVKQHDGWVDVRSYPGNGATFILFFPASEKSLKPTDSLTATPECARGNETILLVEDEPALRFMARAVLVRFGYNVHIASSGMEALTEWPKHREKVDLLLTDMVMPEGLSGTDLAKKLQAEKPGLKVICSSGYSQQMLEEGEAGRDGFKFLPKPYSPQMLTAAVRDCLDGKIPLAASVSLS